MAVVAGVLPASRAALRNPIELGLQARGVPPRDRVGGEEAADEQAGEECDAVVRFMRFSAISMERRYLQSTANGRRVDGRDVRMTLRFESVQRYHQVETHDTMLESLPDLRPAAAEGSSRRGAAGAVDQAAITLAAST